MVTMLPAAVPAPPMLIQLKGPKGERGWLVHAPDLRDPVPGVAIQFVLGGEDELRAASRFGEQLPVYAELNVSTRGFNQAAGQAVWRASS